MKNAEEALLQMIKDSGDLLRKLYELYLWDKRRNEWLPFALELGNTGRESRQFIGPHNLWDLTNDQAHAETIKRVLTPPESPTGDFDDFDDV